MSVELTDGLEIELRREEEDYRDLMNDFEFVKELNKELSLRYQDFIDSLPTVEEVDLLISTHEAQKNISKQHITEKSNLLLLKSEQRLFQLRRFRSACVILEKDNVKAKPIKYEELFGNG